jgi:hypothetical protein
MTAASRVITGARARPCRPSFLGFRSPKIQLSIAHLGRLGLLDGPVGVDPQNVGKDT